MQPVSLVDSGFVPRKEFIRDQRTTSDFSLLAISGSSFIRLYSFPLEVIADLRRLFDHFYLNAGFREDAAQKLCEFHLNGKPWASPKSPRTERILLDILAVIYKHSYSILSTIDYGRERDDRLAISFSRLSAPPLPIPHSPVPGGSGSNLSHGTGSRHERKMPFAISFISSTVMRVIYPPLNSTPAILQAVRGSWPRGVVSEKKVGDAAYEFKLKGYSWFNEDTFATDSLHQILSLLTSLDGHACTMVTSLSICGRSRVKDLWVFTGPGSAETYDQYWPESPISQSGSMLDVRRSNRASTPDPGSNPEAGVIPSSLHRRVATAPQHLLPPLQSPPAPHHVRAATETNGFPTPFSTTLPLSSPRAVPGNGMRKPAPRAQVPVSVDFDAQDDDEHDRYRTSLPSAVASSCENMTGIGTLNRNKFTSNLIYTATPGAAAELDHDDEETVHSPPERHRSRSPSPQRRVSALRPVSTRSKTPPLLTSHPRDPRTPSPPANGSVMSTSQTQDLLTLGEHPPLLSPGMFRIRDSAFSSNSVDTTGSYDVPIRWTGLGRPEGIENIEEEQEVFTEEPKPHHPSPPILPGGWAVPPEEEVPEANTSQTDENTVRPEHGRHPDRSLHDVDARVASPELIHDGAVRKSEAGMIGVIPPPRSPPPPLPMPSRESLGKSKGSSNDPPASPTKTGSRNGSGSGWVLVNVEHANVHSSSPLGSPTIPHQDHGRKASHLNEKALVSPSAKAILVIDGKDGKGARGRAGGSGLRRLLSLSRPGKGAEELRNDTRLTQTRSHELTPNGQSQPKDTARPGRFRNKKLSRLGPVESPSKPPDRVRIKLD
ncbi:hypothetical protein HYDPIDRAFT_24561 [Hydnomerulius pinastri MD-312]|nr:hypothetical protein HYDPIDRAFT_24561 [Hydnomerulius pinastri MD-312]